MVSLSDPKCQITKLKAMAIAPKVTGIISLFSSTFIIQHVLRSRKRRSLTYHRLLLGMSISDFFGSLMCFLSTWPIPRGEACLAAGTTATCTAQGFFDQTAALCTPTYNVSLAIYYMLVIVKGWKECRVSKIEKYLHALPILAGFGTGFAALGLKLYNSAGWICWIAPAPNNPDRHNPNYGIYRLAFMYSEAWAIMIFLTICMTIIYFHVLKQEKRLDKYRARRFSQKKRKQSKKIRNQAFLYVGCVYMTWIFGSVRFGIMFSNVNCFIWYSFLNFPPVISCVFRSFVSCNLRGRPPRPTLLSSSSPSFPSRDSLTSLFTCFHVSSAILRRESLLLNLSRGRRAVSFLLSRILFARGGDRRRQKHKFPVMKEM